MSPVPKLAEVYPFERFPVIDPLVDVETEEGVLSAMLWGAKVISLDPSHFTGHDRPIIYRLLRIGTPYPDVHQHLEDPVMVTDIYFAPTMCHKRLCEAVAELKRLRELRRLAHAVDEWRRQMPYLEPDKAISRLVSVIRSRGPGTGSGA